ncbi:hypothetical protein EST38_g9978 [Candolleomyces aberdarensis]|uniref:NYN domain-containing protein n=1 Tax=Candolleomyces aberdarensis TaxID=2316362 RepID=A0A4Q2D8K4_9AGAR|nr:hypothetical protein EST38_g9978 [Candolleomyces aberdarensis]
MLIAGDPSFSYLLSVLRMRSHRIVVLGPGGRTNAGNKNSASLASQANLWLDWNTEVVGNIRIVIPRSTATGGSSASQTTENFNPTPNTKSKRTSESRDSKKRASAMAEDTLERVEPLAGKDHKAEVNSIADSFDEEEEAHSQQSTHQSTPQEPASVKLDPWATGWQWDPIASANTKASSVLSPTESEDLPQDPTANLKPTITTPSTEAETVQDNPHKPQPRYADCDWEGSPNSTQSTQLRDRAPVGWLAPSSAKRSEEDYSWDDWPPLQATLGSSALSQTPSQPNGNPPEYSPSDDSDWMSEKAPISSNGVAPHFQTSAAPSAPEPQPSPPAPQDAPVVVSAPQQLAATTTPVVTSSSSNASGQTQIVPPAAASASTQATTPLPAAAPATSTSASTPSKSLDGVAPHFQHLIDVLRDLRSQGIMSVERGGNVLPLLQKRDRDILVAAGTAQYRGPFALYLEDAHEAGIITSGTGPIQLAPKYR